MSNLCDGYPVRRSTLIIATLAVLLAAGCDSNGSNECRRTGEDTYTASAPLVDPLSQTIVAQFGLQQEIRSYQSESCEIPAGGFSETRLIIRNLTSCELSFDYRLSVFEGREGSTIEGAAFIRQGAVDDQGVVLRNSGIRVDRAQIIITAEDVAQESCG